MVSMDLILPVLLAVIVSSPDVHGANMERDTREGESITLECRFSPALSNSQYAFYWETRDRFDKINVATIGQNPLGPYRMDYRPAEGRYDIHISNISYATDDRTFTCRIKEIGSGKEMYSQSYKVTVLTPPSAPVIGPSSNPTATEGKSLELTCASQGGSPEPVIRWYRQGKPEPLEAIAKTNPEQGVVSTLSLLPEKTDDGAVFRCTVWNRAMTAGSKLESSVTLNVNYYPRVSVGPENPYRIERDGSAKIECIVDSKPRVSNVRWIRDGKFISTSFTYSIQQVTVQDSGRYRCSADNGLGQAREAELFLDVQYPPQVTIDAGPGVSRQKEVEEGEMVTMKCNVSANPRPISIEWLREGRHDFRQNGESLRLPKVTAESAGTYVCRARNIMGPSNENRQSLNRVGNATITILVRHKPGRAQISPDRPIATEGNGVTLTCSATPPGWPTPQYRWWRESDDLSNPQERVLATGPKYNIPSVHMGSEGKYFCQGTNEMGHGDIATVLLTVHQPPKFSLKLQPYVTKKIGDSDFSVTCGAQGKPKPLIQWLKDHKELPGTLFDVSTDESEGHNGVYTVKSTLRFSGRDRPGGSQLIPADRGPYTCIFQNEVKKTDSTMQLRIEHEPITLHPYDKVAYDLKETAEVICKAQAYPRPEFQWSFGTYTAPLLSGSDGHYEIATNYSDHSGGDIYTSVLRINNVRQADYGEYNCRVANSLGKVKTQIRLQSKGPPEKPESLNALEVGHNYILLQWRPGFDGGMQNTKYFIAYKRVLPSTSDDCYTQKKPGNNAVPENWNEFDCQKSNPCNVTSLDQHQSYTFKVKAYNTKGQSNYSEEEVAMTKVDRIPAPQHVTFDPDTQSLSINVAATCLKLIGMVEASTGIFKDEWRVVDTVPLTPSSISYRHEGKLNSLMPRRAAKTSGRSLSLPPEYDDEDIPNETPSENIRVRVRLCLESNTDTCGDYTEAEIGPSYLREHSTIAMPTLVAIVVSCIVFILFSCLAVVFCKCKRTQAKKSSSKDYEMDSSAVHPSIVQQPPPPYYPASGMENKALEHSMDLALDDNGKGSVYASQNGYGYHVSPQTHPNGGEWVNMAYMENSYSNSNNGGSVNSQDSLWQMKMAAQANNAANLTPNPEHHHHHPSERNNHYGVYDPMVHGGYGAVDDYAPYPHLLPAAPEYSRSNNPSRQDYAPDKSLRQHIESPYRDVSGLPDPYMEHHMMMEEEMKHQPPATPQQMMAMSFDETLESGYSTPNSRARRMIREIIV